MVRRMDGKSECKVGLNGRIAKNMRRYCIFFQEEDGIRDLVRSRGLGDVYKRQAKGRAGLIGTLLGGMYKLARDHEKARLREQTKHEMGQHMANAKQKPETAHDSLQLERDTESHIIDKDLPILSTEKKLKKAAQAFGDYMNG